MATLYKSRARKPLAQSDIGTHGADYERQPEGRPIPTRLGVSVYDRSKEDGHRYALDLSRHEALSLMCQWGKYLTQDRLEGVRDVRKTAEVLRAVADACDRCEL